MQEVVFLSSLMHALAPYSQLALLPLRLFPITDILHFFAS